MNKKNNKNVTASAKKSTATSIKAKSSKNHAPLIMDHEEDRMTRPDTPPPLNPLMDRPLPPPHQSLYQNVAFNKNTQKENITIPTIPSKRISSNSRMIPPSLAAAMLSLPWPPPAPAVTAILRKEEEEAAKAKREAIGYETETLEQEKDNNNGNLGGCCGGKSGPCCCAGGQKTNAEKKSTCIHAQCSRKIITKGKSQIAVGTEQPNGKYGNEAAVQNEKLVINGNPRRKPGEPYHAVRVPPFGHVYTAWPGFDHAPLPNWRKKYMIAKPWPYHEQQQRFKDRSHKVSFPDETGLHSRATTHLDLLNEPNISGNFTGRSLASLRSPSNLSNISRTPKAHIHVNKILQVEELQW